MKEENKKELRKGILTGAGTAAGAIVGALVENTINAAYFESKDTQEVEVVDAIVEDPNEDQETESITTEVESVTSQVIADDVAPHTHKPERKPAQHNISDTDLSSGEEIEPIVEAEVVIENEIESEVNIEPQVANEEVQDDDEDIPIVTVTPETTEEDVDIQGVTIATVDNAETSFDSNELPDYADMKDSDLNVGGSTLSAVDIPDYVNDANIDSFTNNV